MPTIDPSLQKLWHAWASFGHEYPYWDPYGAAMTLVLGGILLGLLIYRLVF